MLVSAAKQVRQFVCGLHGHDALLHFDQRHVSLRCVLCGHESPGWNLPGAASATTADAHLTSGVLGHLGAVREGGSRGETPHHAHRDA